MEASHKNFQGRGQTPYMSSLKVCCLLLITGLGSTRANKNEDNSLSPKLSYIFNERLIANFDYSPMSSLQANGNMLPAPLIH